MYVKNQILISLTGYHHKIKEVKNNFIHFDSIIGIIHINTLNTRVKKGYYILKK